VRRNSRISFSVALISGSLFGLGLSTPVYAADPLPCYVFSGSVITDIGSCTGEIVIGPDITEIGDGAFDPYVGWNFQTPLPEITSVDLSASNIVSIGDHVFSNNAQLTSVILPASLLTIGDSAFAGDSKLQNIVFPSSLTFIGGNSFCMSQIFDITIPDSVTEIAGGAFIGNEALTSVTIGSGLTTLGLNAIPANFQGNVTVSPENKHFKTIDGKLYTISGTQLTGLTSLFSPDPEPDQGSNGDASPKNNDNSAPSDFKGNSKSQAQSESNGKDLATRELPSDNLVQFAADRAAAERAAADRAAKDAAVKREAEKQASRSDISVTLKNAKELSVDSFAKAGIPGITSSNIAEVQAELLALPEEFRSDIKEILKVAYKYEVVGKIASEQVTRMSPNTFVEVGLIPEASKNKTSLVAAVKKLPAGDRDSYAEIKKAIEVETKKIEARKDRLAAIVKRSSLRSTRV